MKTRHLIYILAVALLLSAPLLLTARRASAQTRRSASKRRTPRTPCPEKCYALVVGVEDYDSGKIATYVGAAADAQNLASSLYVYTDFSYENVTLLADGGGSWLQGDAPTRENILFELSRLSKKVPPDGLLLVSFTGHGIEHDGHSYLLPTDAAASDSVRTLEETAIRVDLLKEIINASKARQVCILLDTHAQQPFPEKRGNNPLTLSFSNSWKFGADAGNRRKITTLFASSVGQRSYATEYGGYFANAVAEGLEQLPDNRYITFELLVSYVSRKVPAQTRRRLEKGQTPHAVVEGKPTIALALSEPVTAYETGRNAWAGSMITRSRNSHTETAGGGGMYRRRRSPAARPSHQAGGVWTYPGARPTPTPTPSGRKSNTKRINDNAPGGPARSSVAEDQRRIYPETARSRTRGTSGDVGPAERADAEALIAQAYWETVKQSHDPEELRAYINQYPNGQFAKLANARIQTLKSKPGNELERYPSVRCPEEAQVGRRYVVLAQLTRERKEPEQTAPGRASKPIEVPGKADGTPWKVDVILDAEGFAFVNGSNVSTITLTDDADSSLARFDLVPKPINTASQTRRVSVLFWYEGTALGEVTRDVVVTDAAVKPEVGETANAAGVPGSGPRVATRRAFSVGQSAAAPPAPVTRMRSQDSGGSEGGAPAPAPPPVQAEVERQPEEEKIVINRDRVGPDMTIWVRRVNPSQPGAYFVEIFSPHYRERLLRGTYIRPEELSTLLNHYYGLVLSNARGAKAARPAGSDEPATPRGAALMRDFGMGVFKSAPQIFKDTFWDLSERLNGKIRNIAVYYDDDILPWELMRPVKDDGNDEHDFLGAECMVSRWHVEGGLHKTPQLPTELEVKEVYAIAPLYMQSGIASGQEKELEALAQFPGYVRIHGQREDMEKLFGDLPSGIIHFAGHGGVEPTEQNINEYYIELEDGRMNVEEWRGGIRNLRGNHPLIFFNACSVGETQRVADIVNGWGPAALNAQASGYIGTLWPVDNDGAADFGSIFYSTLLKRSKSGSVTVSELMRNMRQRFIENRDPTFLAYVYFGDPELMLKVDADK